MKDEISQFRGRYRFLSNFYPCEIHWRGWCFPSVEYAYQCLKSKDTREWHAVLAAESPGQAKKIGRSLTLRPDWEDKKIGFMRTLLKRKFSDPILRAKLKATGTAELIEGNTWGDTFWGVCNGVGQNWLGRLLMEVRAGL